MCCLYTDFEPCEKKVCGYIRSSVSPNPVGLKDRHLVICRDELHAGPSEADIGCGKANSINSEPDNSLQERYYSYTFFVWYRLYKSPLPK